MLVHSDTHRHTHAHTHTHTHARTHTHRPVHTVRDTNYAHTDIEVASFICRGINYVRTDRVMETHTQRHTCTPVHPHTVIDKQLLTTQAIPIMEFT